MLCKRLEGIGTKIILCTQTPYDEYLESDEMARKRQAVYAKSEEDEQDN